MGRSAVATSPHQGPDLSYYAVFHRKMFLLGLPGGVLRRSSVRFVTGGVNIIC